MPPTRPDPPRARGSSAFRAERDRVQPAVRDLDPHPNFPSEQRRVAPIAPGSGSAGSVAAVPPLVGVRPDRCRSVAACRP